MKNKETQDILLASWFGEQYVNDEINRIEMLDSAIETLTQALGEIDDTVSGADELRAQVNEYLYSMHRASFDETNKQLKKAATLDEFIDFVDAYKQIELDMDSVVLKEDSELDKDRFNSHLDINANLAVIETLQKLAQELEYSAITEERKAEIKQQIEEEKAKLLPKEEIIRNPITNLLSKVSSLTIEERITQITIVQQHPSVDVRMSVLDNIDALAGTPGYFPKTFTIGGRLRSSTLFI